MKNDNNLETGTLGRKPGINKDSVECNGNDADTSSGTLQLRSGEATDDDLSLCTTQSTTGTKIVPSDHLIGASLGDPTSNDIDEKLLSSVRKKVKLTNVRKKVKLTNARKKVKLKFVWKKFKLKFVWKKVKMKLPKLVKLPKIWAIKRNHVTTIHQGTFESKSTLGKRLTMDLFISASLQTRNTEHVMK